MRFEKREISQIKDYDAKQHGIGRKPYNTAARFALHLP